MPLPPDGAPAGSVPLDAIDAGRVADLLAGAAALAAALVGQPAAEAACADAASDYDGLEDLHIALAVAAADLDQAIAGHRPGHAAQPARTHLENSKQKGAACPAPHREYRLLYLNLRPGRPAMRSTEDQARPERARQEDNRDTQHQPREVRKVRFRESGTQTGQRHIR
jgi:hypothetical protein